MHSMENGGWDLSKVDLPGMSQKLLSFSDK
jgi:hypothetical protein